MKLIDYKGKYTIVYDDEAILDDAFEWEIGTITREEVIAQAKERIEACRYYGIPAYVGKDLELNKIFNTP